MRKYLEIVLVAFAIAIPASAIAQSLLTTEATKVKITMLQNEYDREVKRCKDASILYEGFEVPALCLGTDRKQSLLLAKLANAKADLALELIAAR